MHKPDESYLSSLRLLGTGSIRYSTRRKNAKQVKWFANPEAETESLLTFNRRKHSNVSQISYYEPDGRHVYSNKKANQWNRKRKTKNRENMLIEKYLGAYNADKMEYQAMIFEKDSGTCWYCSADIEEPEKKNDRGHVLVESGVLIRYLLLYVYFSRSWFCNFCFQKWSEMNTSKKALGDRRLEKKKNRDHRKLKVTIEKPMSSKEKLSPKKKLEKCPKIIIHKPDESDSENSDSSDEETMGKSKYVVSRFTKKFVLGKIKLLSYFTPVCY